MKKSEKEVKESKEIRTRSRETDVTDVTGDSTTWHPPGLRRLHFFPFRVPFVFFCKTASAHGSRVSTLDS